MRSSKIMEVFIKNRRWLSQHIKRGEKGSQKFVQYDAIFVMKNDYLIEKNYEIITQTIKIGNLCMSTWVTLTCFYLFIGILWSCRNKYKLEIYTGKSECYFACYFNNRAALALGVGLDSPDASTCLFLGSAELVKISGYKHNLQLKEICLGTSREESQIVRPILQPTVSLEE